MTRCLGSKKIYEQSLNINLKGDIWEMLPHANPFKKMKVSGFLTTISQ